jgi:glycine betaine/proline transport system substrate-binding protein
LKLTYLRFLALIVLLLIILTGCSQSSAENTEPPPGSGKRAIIGYVNWDESVAVSALTKVLLEDELGYKDVELRASKPERVFGEVADGELDAFPGAWMPRHESRVEEVEDGAALFASFLIGNTRSSLAVPAYMDIRKLEGLKSVEAGTVLGQSPEASALTDDVPKDVLRRYGLQNDLDYPSTRAMIEKMVGLMQDEKPFVFVAYSPHWMNLRYDFNYLEDPKGELDALTQPSTLHILVDTDLAEREPVAQALLDVLRLSDYELSSLELKIHQSQDPVEGARTWVEDNEDLTESWIGEVEERVGQR